MNYQMCKNCGLANASTASACMRCNFRFDLPINQAQQQPPKTADTLGRQPNYAATPPTKKDNSTMYLIFGGLAALVLVGGLLIGALVIGYFVYSAKTNVAQTDNRTPYPNNSRSTTPTDNKNNSDGTVFGDEELAAVFSIKKQVGRFTHLSTLPANSADKKTFQNSGGEATAMYVSKNTSENIIYSIASYSSRELAQTEFRSFITREKQNGGRMIAEIITDEKNKSINASYKLGDLTILSFCSWKTDTMTLCHRIGSSQGNTVIDFHNSWFNVK